MAPTGSTVQVSPVRGRRATAAFIALPHRLYAGDPHWIAPLAVEQKRRLFGANPFFEHAEAEAWLATVSGRPAGRITAQIDRLHEEREGKKVGYFGMLEAEKNDPVIDSLLETAETWLRRRGVRAVRGPFNLSINEESGLLVDGFDSSPYMLMGHAPPWMGGALEARNYHKARDLYTYTVNTDFQTPPVMKKLAARTGNEVTIRSLDRKRAAEEFETLRDIFNDAWSENWGFVPFTRAEFADLGKTLSFLVPDDQIQIAEVGGRPAAFIVILPNINEASRDLNGRLLPLGWLRLLWRLKAGRIRSGRVPLMGVRKRFQQSRLGPALAFMVIDAVRKKVVERGMQTVEMGWVLEDNSAMRNIIETIGGEQYKIYRVYQKFL